MRYDNAKSLNQNFAELMNLSAAMPQIKANQFTLANPAVITPGAGNGNKNTSIVVNPVAGQGIPATPSTTLYYNRLGLDRVRPGVPKTIYVTNTWTLAQLRAEILARFGLTETEVSIVNPIEGMPLAGDEAHFYVTPVVYNKLYTPYTMTVRVINTSVPAAIASPLSPTTIFGTPDFQRNGRNVWVINRPIPTTSFSVRYQRSGSGQRFMRILADYKANRSDFKFINRPGAIVFGVPTAGTQSGYTGMNTFVDFEIGDGTALLGNGTFMYQRSVLGTITYQPAPLEVQQTPIPGGALGAQVAGKLLFDALGLPTEDGITWTNINATLTISASWEATHYGCTTSGFSATIRPLPTV